MKRLTIILSVILLSSSHIHGQVKSYKDILGKWDIVGEDMPGASLEIFDSTKIFLTYMGEKRQVISPLLDTKKNPAWFDFTIIDSTSGPIQVKTIIQVYSNGVMKWQLFIEEDRSSYFTSSKGELMYLKKTKSETAPVAVTQDPK